MNQDIFINMLLQDTLMLLQYRNICIYIYIVVHYTYCTYKRLEDQTQWHLAMIAINTYLYRLYHTWLMYIPYIIIPSAVNLQ